MTDDVRSELAQTARNARRNVGRRMTLLEFPLISAARGAKMRLVKKGTKGVRDVEKIPEMKRMRDERSVVAIVSMSEAKLAALRARQPSLKQVSILSSTNSQTSKSQTMLSPLQRQSRGLLKQLPQYTMLLLSVNQTSVVLHQ
jgi:hypothetical protein